MLSTLVLASTALAQDLPDDVASVAAIMGKLEAAPENELLVELGKYNTCPGAQNAVANIHTMAQMEVTFQNSCADVAAEVQARGNMEGGFVDPHNAGKYQVLAATDNLITLKRRTGNNKYTDKQTFALSANGSGCKAQICSESQGTSANDGGTNLCDMFDLFCNSGETNPQNGVSCKPVKTDLQYTVDKEECGRYYFQNGYAAHQCENKQTTCLKVASTAHAEAISTLEQPPKHELAIPLEQYQICPGNNAVANIHTMAQMKVNFQDSCDKVQAEIVARGNMQNGWTDPHNGGKYDVLMADSNLIQTKRRTGNNKYTDKQTFSLQANGAGCTATVCSVSQGTSANDAGTNLCDMYNLFCNSSEMNQQTGVSCKPVENDLAYTVESEQCGRYVLGQYLGHQCEARNPTCLKTGATEELSAPGPITLSYL